MGKYADFHRRSIEQREPFWSEEAKLIDWQTPPSSVCDYSRPPFAKWFSGGTTNLCHNAVDRHAATRPNDRALVYISTETNEEKVYTFAELISSRLSRALVERAMAGLGSDYSL